MVLPVQEDRRAVAARGVYDAVTGARDAVPAGDAAGRLRAMARTFRRWSLADPAAFGLLLGPQADLPASTEPPATAVVALFRAGPGGPDTWAWLYGTVAAEVFGHAPVSGPDADRCFEAGLAAVTHRLYPGGSTTPADPDRYFVLEPDEIGSIYDDDL